MLHRQQDRSKLIQKCSSCGTLHVATILSCFLVKSPHNVISVEGNVALLTCNIEVCIT